MEARVEVLSVIEVDTSPRTGFRINVKPLRFVVFFLVSSGIPLLILLMYMDFAAAHGVVLEKGCEGPGIPFSLMSGILFALQLRWFEIS